MTDDVHEIWSDDQLDRALAALHSEVDTDRARLAKARVDLVAEPIEDPVSDPAVGLSTPDGQRRRHPAWWVVAAAAVLAVVAGFLAVQAIPFGEKRPAASAAVVELNSTADRVGAPDPPLRPGQYRYVNTHAWYQQTAALVDKAGNQTTDSLTLLGEQVTETWLPQDPKEECLIRSGTTGNYKWIKGSDVEAKAAGLDLPTAQTEDRRERCLDHPGNWQQPNPEWLAALPRAPVELYNQLRAATEGRGRDPDLELLVYIADTMRGGQVPTDLRVALYRALALVPALEITTRSANLDGRVGVAYGVNRAGVRQEMIIDPDTGQFIGERETLTTAMDGLPVGTVTASTSVTTGVAPAIGVKPAG
jgi:hypothetical protein